MSTIGLIGSGMIGGTVASLAVQAGHDVVLSNRRGPDTLAELVAELGPRARAATPVEAAEAADLVVVTVPLKAYLQVPVEPLRGKTVIDTNNYYPQRDRHIEALDGESTTVSELLQAHLPDAHVVKALNNISFVHLGELGRPSSDPERSVLAIAGDDPNAKEAASVFLDSIGYDTLDAGPLAEGWRYQRDTPAYGTPYAIPGSSFGVPGTGRRVTAETLRARLTEAVRYRDM